MTFDPLQLPQPSRTIRYNRIVVTEGVIKSQRPLTHDTFEIVVESASNDQAMFAVAGQFATLRFPGIEQPRPYSFARDPDQETSGQHTFYIRLVPDGEVSNWLAAQDRTGETVEIAGPLGQFGLDDSNEPMLCIAGGSGMSAVMSIIEAAAAKQVDRDCFFYYGARTQADLYCADRINELASQWLPSRRFEFVNILSEEPVTSDWSGARGFVTDVVKHDLIDPGVVDPKAVSVFFCGPPPMIKAGAELLETAGTPAEKIFRDEFEDARSPAPVIDNRQCVLCDECLLVKPVPDCIIETAGLEIDGEGNVTGFERINPAHSSGLYYNTLFIDESRCIRCYACVNACPHDAISPAYAVNRTLRQKGIN